MSKLTKKKFLAFAVDTDTIWVKCSIPVGLCPHKIHEYESNGVWNGNHKKFVKSKCFCNYDEEIELNVTRLTIRSSIIGEEFNEYVLSRKVFQDKLKKYRKLQDLGKTENLY